MDRKIRDNEIEIALEKRHSAPLGEALSDEEIERLLFSSDEIVPEGISKKVSPSRRAFLLTIWGLALSALLMPPFRHDAGALFSEFYAPITWLRLDLILPAAGTALTLIGLRMLRGVNRAFGFSYIMSLARAAVFILTLIFTFSVLHEGEAGKARALALTAASVLTMLSLIFGVYAGFRELRARIGFEPRSGEFAVFALWYLLLTAFAIENSQSVVLVLGMPFSFALILLAMCLLTQSFDEAGYAVHAERTRFSALALFSAWVPLVACTLIFTFSCLGKYRMHELPREARSGNNEYDSSVNPSSGSVQARERQALAARLTGELKLPENMINDLSDNELMLLSAPKRGCVTRQAFMLDGGSEGAYVIPGGSDGSYIIFDNDSLVSYPNETGIVIQVPDIGPILVPNIQTGAEPADAEADLTVTTAAVEVDGGEWPNRVVFIHYFEFNAQKELRFPGTEAIRIIPVNRDAANMYMFEKAASGRLIYEREGRELSSPFAKLESPGLEVGGSVSVGTEMSEDGSFVTYKAYETASSPDGYIYASFSVPDGAGRVRGYIIYSILGKIPEPGLANLYFTLVHQRTAANLSGKTAYETLRFGRVLSDAFLWMNKTMIFDRAGMSFISLGDYR